MHRDPRCRLLAALLLTVTLFALLTVLVSSHEGLSLSARAAALYEPQSGTFLYRKEADRPLPMASTTKIMTALVAVERLPLGTPITADAADTGIEGSSLYLRAGETLTLEGLLYGMLLSSANDAACVIARAVGGSPDGFAALMNEKAAAMGLTDTHFTNPHGLYDPEHYTTAAELAQVAAAFLAEPTLRAIAATERATVTSADGYQRTLKNHNKLLSLYPGAIGVKTGFTRRSGRCLVGAAEREGLTLISVTIDAPDDWRDHEQLLDYGFSQMEARQLAAYRAYQYRLPVVGGADTHLLVSNQEALTHPLLRSARISTQVCLPRYAVAPIRRGDEVGYVVFSEGGRELARLPLLAEEDISSAREPSWLSNLLNKIFHRKG